MAELVERLRDYAQNGYRHWNGIQSTFTEAAARIEALEKALEPFAKQKTPDELLRGEEPQEWDDASVERRIQMLGERRRQKTADILAARKALGGDGD